MSDASVSKEMRPPAVEAVQSAAQCTPYIFLCRVPVDFVRCLEESCMNTITSVRIDNAIVFYCGPPDISGFQQFSFTTYLYLFIIICIYLQSICIYLFHFVNLIKIYDFQRFLIGLGRRNPVMMMPEEPMMMMSGGAGRPSSRSTSPTRPNAVVTFH